MSNTTTIPGASFLSQDPKKDIPVGKIYPKYKATLGRLWSW
jgi:hypothetical protein